MFTCPTAQLCEPPWGTSPSWTPGCSCEGAGGLVVGSLPALSGQVQGSGHTDGPGLDARRAALQAGDRESRLGRCLGNSLELQQPLGTQSSLVCLLRRQQPLPSPSAGLLGRAGPLTPV